MSRVIPKLSLLISSLGALTVLCAGGVAQAHFKLLAPTSWLKEDQVGGPQKGSPCGPGNTGPLGDDVSPVPESGKVTEVHAGDTLMVDLQETIYHPGYFRIALAEKRTDLTIPPVDDPSSCALDLTKVPTGAHDNVLMDGLWKEESMSGSNRHLTQPVKLPNTPCENCTLQIVQVMKNHGLSSCYYYHCANLKILPAATTGTAGGAGSASAAGAASIADSAGVGGSAGTNSSGRGAVSAGATGTSVAGIGGSLGTPATASSSAGGSNAAVGGKDGSVAAPVAGSSMAIPKAATSAGVVATTAAASGATSTLPAVTSGVAGSSSSTSDSNSGSCSVAMPGMRQAQSSTSMLLVAALLLAGLGRRRVRRRLRAV